MEPIQVKNNKGELEYTIKLDTSKNSSSIIFKIIYPNAFLFIDMPLHEILSKAFDDVTFVVCKEYTNIIMDENIFNALELHVEENLLTVSGIYYDKDELLEEYI